MLRLPHSLTLLEQRAHDLAQELGLERFLKATGKLYISQLVCSFNLMEKPEDNKSVILTIQLAKSKLYEAKVGVVENQRRAELNTGQF